MGTVDVFMTCSGCSFRTFMPHLRWDIAGGVSQEQVDTIDMQEAEKLIDQSAPQRPQSISKPLSPF